MNIQRATGNWARSSFGSIWYSVENYGLEYAHLKLQFKSEKGELFAILKCTERYIYTELSEYYNIDGCITEIGVLCYDKINLEFDKSFSLAS